MSRRLSALGKLIQLLPVRYKVLLFCILLVDVFTRNAQAQECNGAKTFEKTSGFRLDQQQSQTRVIISQVGYVVLPDCLSFCKDSSSCNVFNIDYTLGQCVSIGVDEGKRELLKANPSSSYFEKICLSGVSNLARTCENRFWAFERVIGATLRGFDDKEEHDVTSRIDCEQLCLTETSFTCHSAEYDSTRSTCILSREDRRSQPTAFVEQAGSNVDYLENQCVTRTPQGCPYSTQEGQSVVAIEEQRSSSSESECQSFCDQSRFFICRSYTYIPIQRICYMSGEDITSFSAVSASPGALYGERQCTSNQCTGGIITFEKVTGFQLELAKRDILVSRNNGNTANCLNQCKANESPCPAAIVDYAHSTCYRLDRSTQGREQNLLPVATGGLSYFEQICLQGRTQSCAEKLWAFELVINHELQGFDTLVIQFVQSRRECQEKCVQHTNFPCRSAEYDYQSTECSLSREDRRSQPEAFVGTDRRIDYMENQCIEEEASTCEFIRKQEGIPRYVDAIISEVESLKACRNACSSEDTIKCRSFSYRPSSKECLLSADDSVSGGAFAIIPSKGLFYYEIECQYEPGNETTVAPHLTSTVSYPFPFSPPTQDPFFPPATLPPYPTTAGRCVGGIGKTEFEKTTGYKIPIQLFPLHDGGNELGITKQCIIKCNIDPTCQGFVLDYVSNKCFALKNEPSLSRGSLQRAQSTSYFEPVCYQASSSCGKLWTFERFVQKQLKTTAKDVIKGVTKVDCEQSCLIESRFMCRSANYDADQKECHINEEDRYGAILQDSSSFDYLENQCYQYGTPPASIIAARITTTSTTNRPPRLRHDYDDTEDRPNLNIHPRKSIGACYFSNEERSSALSYVERTLHVASESECQIGCDLEPAFNCRSYTFSITGPIISNCYISSDTKNSVGAEFHTKAGSSYAERICPPANLPFPNPRPLPPVPFYPELLKPYPNPPGEPYPNAQYPHQLPRPPYLPPPHPQQNHNGQIFPNPYPGVVQNPNPFERPARPFPPQPPFTTQWNAARKPETPFMTSEGQLFPLPSGPASFSPGPVRCFYETDLTFERITGLASQGFGSDIRVSHREPTTNCLGECVAFGDQCQAVTFNFNDQGYTSQCTSYTAPSGGGQSSPVVSSQAAYFQKVCLPGPKCGKAWTFERVPFYHIENHDDLELRNIGSREECETACLHQEGFPCRSAEFYSSQSLCRLSRETRRSQPNLFKYADGVEYLENNCNHEPGFCGFTDFPNKFPRYFDKKINGILSLYECQSACSRETQFLCRSVALDEGIKDCYLSSCDRFCGYEIVERPYAVYSERLPCPPDYTSGGFEVASSYLQPSSSRMVLHGVKPLRQAGSPTSSECVAPLAASFERTTGYSPLSTSRAVIPTARLQGVTKDCVKHCLGLKDTCKTFVLSYLSPPATPECLLYSQKGTLFAPTAGVEHRLHQPDIVFFEKFCYKDVPIYCDKLWVFDRLFGHELTDGYFMDFEAVTTRQECEELCLRHTTQPCRSASYSSQMRLCRLNTESRDTNPDSLRFIGGDIEYVENQCAD